MLTLPESASLPGSRPVIGRGILMGHVNRNRDQEKKDAGDRENGRQRFDQVRRFQIVVTRRAGEDSLTWTLPLNQAAWTRYAVRVVKPVNGLPL